MQHRLKLLLVVFVDLNVTVQREMETGLRLLVTVETVFEGGFVVSCVNPKDSRDVFKGALLRTRQPSSPG